MIFVLVEEKSCVILSTTLVAYNSETVTLSNSRWF